MSDKYEYIEEEQKRIVFTDNMHRHAKLVMKLKYLNVTQAKFFRHIITGMLKGDPRLMSYIEEITPRSKVRASKAEKAKEQGRRLYNDLGFSEVEMGDLFDILESEFPEL